MLPIRSTGLSKLANLLFTKELQRRVDAEGVNIVSIALHPGGVKTRKVSRSLAFAYADSPNCSAGSIKFVGGDANSPLLERSLTPLQGALTSLFAATAPEVQQDKSKYAGAYLMPFGVPSPDDESQEAKDPTLAKELWATTEKIVAHILSK
jgi:NAD(P)-dependent dehydrogenase (short-subunit alcohol dehydrogenase family)